MRLISLRLRNFKGIREFVLEPNGANVTVFGDNATGKTTLFDAFTWLLFDKDSSNRKEFEIKTLGSDGEPVHGLEHEVEATLDLEPGRIELRKTYKEVWTKKRGSARAEFTGHTTDYYIDGVPVKKAEYEAKIREIADESVFRLLTDPAYFNEALHWTKRREILLQVCGDVTDEEVIRSDAALARLPEILAGRTIEQHRKVIAARRAEINKELDRIPVRIDEAQRGLPSIDGIVPEALAGDLAKLRAERQAREEERVRIQAGGEAAELQKRLREIEVEMLAAQARARAGTERAVQEERARLAEVEAQIDARAREVRRLRAEIQDAEQEIQRLEPRVEALRRQWGEVNAEQPQIDVSETCPACGQALPEHRVQEARERAVAEFNARKAARLEEIAAEGKRLKARVDDLRQAMQERQEALQQAEAALGDLNGRADEIRARIDGLRAQAPDPAQDPEYRRLHEERQRVAAELEALRTGNAEALSRVADEIERIDLAIRALEEASARVEARRRGLARIEELKAEERRLAAEYEELERQLYLVERFEMARAALLEERVNRRFKLARFRLFNRLINGGIEPACDTLYQGVPYSTALNTGARINVGLDIINTLSEHYGFTAPIWIDNREAVTRLIPTRAQVISLVVSEPDKRLRVEVEQQPKMALKEAV